MLLVLISMSKCFPGNDYFVMMEPSEYVVHNQYTTVLWKHVNNSRPFLPVTCIGNNDLLLAHQHHCCQNTHIENITSYLNVYHAIGNGELSHKKMKFEIRIHHNDYINVLSHTTNFVKFDKLHMYIREENQV